jgi:hypothetical protein
MELPLFKSRWQKQLFLLCLLAITTFFSGCASAWISDGAYVNEAKGFAVKLPPAAWKVQTGEEADLILRHKHREAGILINASCSEVPPNRPLTILSRHLFFGVREKEILREQRRALSQGEALEVVLRGEMGTMGLLLHGYTVKEHGCVYDLVLFASPRDYPEVGREFDVLVQQFRILPERR